MFNMTTVAGKASVEPPQTFILAMRHTPSIKLVCVKVHTPYAATPEAAPDVQVDRPLWQGVRHRHADLTNTAIEDLSGQASVDIDLPIPLYGSISLPAPLCEFYSNM